MLVKKAEKVSLMCVDVHKKKVRNEGMFKV